MLAFRLTLKVKPGLLDKAQEMAIKMKEVVPDWKGRIYVGYWMGYGPADTIIFEDTYESVAEREAYWVKNSDTPEFGAWWNEWYAEVADSGGSMEVWSLTEI